MADSGTVNEGRRWKHDPRTVDPALRWLLVCDYLLHICSPHSKLSIKQGSSSASPSPSVVAFATGSQPSAESCPLPSDYVTLAPLQELLIALLDLRRLIL